MFKLIYSGAGDMPPVMYLPAGAITPKMGMGLAFSSGVLAISAKPEYMSMIECSAALTSGTMIPVIKIEQDQTWESTLNGAYSSLALGALVDVDAGGLTIDPDGATNQNFLVEWKAGTASGDRVRGRFVRSDGQDNVDAT